MPEMVIIEKKVENESEPMRGSPMENGASSEVEQLKKEIADLKERIAITEKEVEKVQKDTGSQPSQEFKDNPKVNSYQEAPQTMGDALSKSYDKVAKDMEEKEKPSM